MTAQTQPEPADNAAAELAQAARDYAHNNLAPVPTPVREETD